MKLISSKSLSFVDNSSLPKIFLTEFFKENLIQYLTLLLPKKVREKKSLDSSSKKFTFLDIPFDKWLSTSYGPSHLLISLIKRQFRKAIVAKVSKLPLRKAISKRLLLKNCLTKLPFDKAISRCDEPIIYVLGTLR